MKNGDKKEDDKKGGKTSARKMEKEAKYTKEKSKREEHGQIGGKEEGR